MADLKVALVGYGYAGKTIHAPLIESTKGLVLDTIVSSRPEAVRSDLPHVTVMPNLAAVLSDPSIALVVIATPNDLHASQAHQALAADKHVVIDKPFALSVAEGQSILSHAHRVSRLVSVFHCRRWDSNYLTFKHLRPSLGDLCQVILRYDRLRPTVRDRWRERPGPGSGIWYDLGSHLLDQSLSLFGEPDWISADIAIQRSGGLTDDYFHVILAYNRLRVILHSSVMTASPGPAFEAQGSSGAFIKYGMDPQEEMLKAGLKPGSQGWGEDDAVAHFIPVSGAQAGAAEPVATVPGNYPAYYGEIASAISSNTANPVPGSDALKVMKWLELGLISAREGCRQTL